MDTNKESNLSRKGRLKNRDLRAREHLTHDEVQILIDGAREQSRYPDRARLLLTLMYDYGLRVSEAIALRWSSVDLKRKTVFINRVKGSISKQYRLSPTAYDLLRLLKPDRKSEWLFPSEGASENHMSSDAVRKLIQRAGERAGLEIKVHPHMLRHSTGFNMATDGVDVLEIQNTLGHKSLASSGHYINLANDGTALMDYWQRRDSSNAAS